MAVTTHDYDFLHKEFIGSDISIRALAAKHGIKSFSAVAKYAREHGWYEERDAVRGRTRAKVVEKVSERLATEEVDEILQFRDDALTVVRAAIYKFAENLKDPQFRIGAADLAKLVQLGLLITGSPTERVEERRLDLHATFNELPADVLRGLVEATRPGAAFGGTAQLPARTGSEGPRPN